MDIPTRSSGTVKIYYERLEPDNFYRGLAQRMRRRHQRDMKQKVQRVRDTSLALATMVANGNFR